MTQLDSKSEVPRLSVGGVTYAGLLQSLVWLMLASSFAVKFTPAITDVIFALAFALAVFGGMSFTAAILPIAALLILYNFAGVLSLIGFFNDTEAVKFILISVLMLLIFVFIVGYIIRYGLNGIRVIQSGWIVGAIVGAVLGIIGAIDLFGTGTIFSDQGRAVALFNDPNVYSTFLIYPAIVLFQGLLLGDKSWFVSRTVGFLTILVALFVAFSRGAWLNFGMSSLLVVGLTFMLSGNGTIRFRILIITALGLIIGAILILVLLSFEPVREMFADRFSLSKNYDLGETGRFGNQLNSIPDLLLLPFGYGPLQFWKYHGQDPHNTFLNAFASYGWLGGVAYLAIVVCSIVAGLKMVFSHHLYQREAIAAFAVLTALFLQGVQIDTEHWRHMFWLLGLLWGIFALSQTELYARQQQDNNS